MSLKTFLKDFLPPQGTHLSDEDLSNVVTGIAQYGVQYGKLSTATAVNMQPTAPTVTKTGVMPRALSLNQTVGNMSGQKADPEMRSRFDASIAKCKLSWQGVAKKTWSENTSQIFEYCRDNLSEVIFDKFDDWLEAISSSPGKLSQTQYGTYMSWFMSPALKADLELIRKDLNAGRKSGAIVTGSQVRTGNTTTSSSGNGKKALHHLISRVGKAAKSLGKIDQLQENLGATDTKLLNIKQAFKAHSHDGKDYKSILGQFLPRLEGCDDDETLDAWFQENYDEVVGAFGLGGSSGLVAPVPVNRKPRGTKTTKSEPVASHVPVRRRRTPAPVVEPVQKATTEDTCDDDDALSIPSLEDVDVDFELDDD